jgi:multicomponent Na+:H+ antiporter subunit C
MPVDLIVPMAAVIGLLTAAAVLLILQRDIIRMVVGIYVLWNAANLFMLSVAAVRGIRAPIVGSGDGAMADPLVQAFVLTGIIITFGYTALLVAVASWLSHRSNSVDIQDFCEDHD